MEGPWPLEFDGWEGADPDEGEWTCDPWREFNVQPYDSMIQSYSTDVSTGAIDVFVDAWHFDESRSAWRVQLLGPEWIELVAPREGKPDPGESSYDEIGELRTYRGRHHVQTVSTELRTSVATGTVHRLDALPPRDRVDVARPVGHTRFMSFLEGPWRDGVVDLRGGIVETISFEPAEAHLVLVLTLEEHQHVGDRRQWRFDFDAVDRLHFCLDDEGLVETRGLITAASIDGDLYLLTGPACTLMVQSASVTASPVPD